MKTRDSITNKSHFAHQLRDTPLSGLPGLRMAHRAVGQAGKERLVLCDARSCRVTDSLALLQHRTRRGLESTCDLYSLGRHALLSRAAIFTASERAARMKPHAVACLSVGCELSALCFCGLFVERAL
jgi:hypothetical protein